MNVEGTDNPTPALAWFTSSHSAGNGGDCVEVAAGDGCVHVRDSKNRAGPLLDFPAEQWASFIAFAARHPSV